MMVFILMVIAFIINAWWIDMEVKLGSLLTALLNTHHLCFSKLNNPIKGRELLELSIGLQKQDERTVS